MATRNFTVWHNMQSEHGQCSWSLSDKDTYPILTVVTPHGQKSTQLGSHPAELLARILMREIYGQANCSDC